MQRILIFICILHAGRIKGPVEGMAAVFAEAETDLSHWSVQGIVPRTPEYIAKDRDPWYFDKGCNISGAADRAGYLSIVHALSLANLSFYKSRGKGAEVRSNGQDRGFQPISAQDRRISSR